MKLKNLMLSLTCMVLAIAGTSCGGSKEPSALVAQSQRLGDELGTLAEESPEFLDSIGVDYAEGVLSVNIAFNGDLPKVSDCSEALVEYVTAQYMKSHAGANLDEIVNTLTKEEGSLKIKLSDASGASREYPIGHARLRQLVRLKPMELNFQDVKSAVADIMAARCAQYKEAVNATDATFEIASGFAQYTLTFEKANAFANQTQGTLQGRYQNVLRPLYDSFGACRPMVEELLRSLQIDGYRFVYTDAKETKTIKTALPWRTING